MENEPKNQNEEKYDLYTENIVTKPLTKYRKIISFFLFLLAAVVFGVIVTVVVSYLYPMLNEPPKETYGNIIIEKDSYPYEPESQTDENQTQEETQGKDIKEVAADIRRSLVLIQIAREDSEQVYVNAEGESQEEIFQSVTGIIINTEDDEGEYGYYILTKYSYLDNARKIAVKFNNGNVYSGTFLGYHAATNMAILYVRVSESQGMDSREVSNCALGSSYGVAAGDDILVMGKIQGNVESFSTGRCVSNSSVKQMLDMNLGVMSTDVPYQAGDDTYIFDTSGKLVGVGVDGSNNSINAYGISDLKNVIEVLINRRNMPCLGIYGNTVTEEIQMAYELPKGIFVSKIAVGSPAFRGGLQTGDVIIKINYAEVRTMSELTTGILALVPEDKMVLTIMRKGNDGYRRVELTFNVMALSSVLGQ
ncbi:MAG: S1C family serine protease [Lachnospiraceae bacterium]